MEVTNSTMNSYRGGINVGGSKKAGKQFDCTLSSQDNMTYTQTYHNGMYSETYENNKNTSISGTDGMQGIDINAEYTYKYQRQEVTNVKNGVENLDVKENYSFQAKVNITMQYVEMDQKLDNGMTIHYHMQPFGVAGNESNPIEEMAMAVWNKASEQYKNNSGNCESSENSENSKSSKTSQSSDGKNTIFSYGWNEEDYDYEDEFTSSDFTKALGDFTDYVKDRLKNGEQKFSIGGLEVSITDWKSMMKKLDKTIDAIHKQVKEEIKEQKEEQEKEKQEEKAINVQNQQNIENGAPRQQIISDSKNEEKGVSLSEKYDVTDIQIRQLLQDQVKSILKDYLDA